MKMLVVSIYGNPSYKFYEYDIEAVLVDADNEEDQEEIDVSYAHTEAEAIEIAKQFSDKYENLADDVWERF